MKTIIAGANVKKLYRQVKRDEKKNAILHRM